MTARPLSLAGLAPPATAAACGSAPELRWLEICRLVVDPVYQREVARAGRANIERIAREFCWAKFAPVIVAPVVGGDYAIIDGQHRSTAALLRGLDRVPCQIVHIDPAMQADAFAAINGAVTPITSLQLYHARVAAGDPLALEAAAACAAAGVTVMRYPVPASLIKPGATVAPAALLHCAKVYGRTALTLALHCITARGEANTGLVRSAAIQAWCLVLAAQAPRWTHDGLIKAAAKFDLRRAFHDAMLVRGAAKHEALAGKIAAYLLQPAPAPAAVPLQRGQAALTGKGHVIDRRPSGPMPMGEPEAGRSALDRRSAAPPPPKNKISLGGSRP